MFFKKIITEMIETQKTFDAVDKYSNTVFNYKRLNIENTNHYFDNCKFSKLITIIISDVGTYQPFSEDCEFIHFLNLIFEQSSTLYLPASAQIRSIQISEAPVNIYIGVKLTVFDKCCKFINELNITVNAKYGDDPSRTLRLYQEAFDCNNAEFETVINDQISQEAENIVISNGDRLGLARFLIVDHLFSLTVLNCETSKLTFIGDIPNDWSMTANKNVVEKIESLKELIIHGSIGARAFACSSLNLELLQVTNHIAEEAFSETFGKVNYLVVNDIDENTFSESKIKWNKITVENPSLNAQIDANIVEIPDSQFIDSISYAKTIIIRDRFEAPIKVNYSKFTEIDFSSVKSPGPFVIYNFVENTHVEIVPTRVFYLTFGLITSSSCEEVYRIIKEDIKGKYLTDFTLKYSNNNVKVYSDNDKLIAYYGFSIDNSLYDMLCGALMGSILTSIFWIIFNVK